MLRITRPARTFSQETFHRMSKYIKSRNPNEKYLRTGHIVLETLKRYHALAKVNRALPISEVMTDKLIQGKLPLSSGSLTSFLEFIPLDVDIEKARQICIKGKQLEVIPPNIGMLLKEVRRIDLSSNCIRDISPLSTLRHVTYISLSKNPMLESIAPLASLQLSVCLLAHCNIRSLRGLEGSASTLKSLVLNDNNVILQSPTGAVLASGKAESVALAVENYKILETLQACETVIFSRNRHLCSLYDTPTTTEPFAEEKKSTGTKQCTNNLNESPHHEPDWAHPLSVFAKMSQLKKLSLTECGLTTLPLRWFMPKATELRFSKNALQTLVPEGVLFRSVKILDVSNNDLSAAATLRRCRFVRQLSISGNPFLTEYCDEVKKQDSTQKLPPRLIHFLTRMMPHLEVVDSIPLLSLKQNENSSSLKEIKETDRSEVDDDQDGLSGKGEAEGAHEVQTIVHARIEKRPREGNSQSDTEKDVVVEPPQAVLDAAHTPSIVRRERTDLLDKQKSRLVADGALVAQLINRRKTEREGCVLLLVEYLSMQFIVVSGDWPTAVCLVPLSQLWRHSVNDGAADAAGPRRITAPALLRLCQRTLDDSPRAGARAPPQLSAFGLAVLRFPAEEPLGPIRLFTPASVGHQSFDVDELAAPRGLVVFAARWDALEAAQALGGLALPQMEKERSAAGSQGELHGGEGGEGGEGGRVQPGGSSRASSASNAGRSAKRAHAVAHNRTSPLQKFRRLETYFTTVGAVTLADVNAVNQLLVSGGIRIDPHARALLCLVCGRLPTRTLTAACCGAIMCPGCAPLRATLCRICGEVPFDDPESHPARDSEVLQVVRELRILYNPQISSIAGSMAGGARKSLLPPPPLAMGGGESGPQPSVLGYTA